jgi:hypothetical protein
MYVNMYISKLQCMYFVCMYVWIYECKYKYECVYTNVYVYVNVSLYECIDVIMDVC